MNLDPALVAIVRCPECKGTLQEQAAGPAGPELLCTACGLAYPVRDDIPILLVDEARRPA